MNDIDREDWVRNDEALYRWWKSANQGLISFVRENRAMLTQYIQRALNKEPKL
jgi:hypothetical protein